MWRLTEHRVWRHTPHKSEIGIGSFPENREREGKRDGTIFKHSGVLYISLIWKADGKIVGAKHDKDVVIVRVYNKNLNFTKPHSILKANNY